MGTKGSMFSPLQPSATFHSWSWTPAAKDQMLGLIVSFVWMVKPPFHLAHKRNWTFSPKMIDIGTLRQAHISIITYSIRCKTQTNAILIVQAKDQAQASLSRRKGTFWCHTLVQGWSCHFRSRAAAWKQVQLKY